MQAKFPFPDRRRQWLFTAVFAALISATSAVAQPSFVAFESGQVRPLALSPDGNQLFAVNTPGNELEIFDVGSGGLAPVGSIPVGMEPVAVAARTNSEVWVVNHLSDSVSIVDLAATPPRVKRTLLVGDEPRDIVFAGAAGNRAFIATAHRGQHRMDPSISGVAGSGDPQLTTEGIGRADVWVFDATTSDTTIGGTPVSILSFFADTPRALATSPNRDTVYVAAFHSGNQTTSIGETVVPNGFDSAIARGFVFELPHLRRQRQSRLESREPRRFRIHQSAEDRPAGADSRQFDDLPSDEGPDDHPDPARPRDPRRDALAR